MFETWLDDNVCEEFLLQMREAITHKLRDLKRQELNKKIIDLLNEADEAGLELAANGESIGGAYVDFIFSRD